MGGDAALCPAGDVCPYGCLDPAIVAAIASAPESSTSIAGNYQTALAAAHPPILAGDHPPALMALQTIKGQARPMVKSVIRPRAAFQLAELAGIRPGMAVMEPCPENTDSPPGATDYTACEVGIRWIGGGGCVGVMFHVRILSINRVFG
jgi:hypothetical protein